MCTLHSCATGDPYTVTTVTKLLKRISTMLVICKMEVALNNENLRGKTQ